jgi:hypothetical protein
MSEKTQGALVPTDVFNAITEYLTQRPYREVHQLIQELRSTTKLIEVPEEKEETVDE